MKKLLLTFVISLVPLAMSAQNVSYDNMMKLADMKSVSEISSTLRSWGYKLGRTQSDDEHDIYIWGCGTAKYDKYLDDWIMSGTRWGIFTYTKCTDRGGIMDFDFPSSVTYDQIKAQVKAHGWTLSEETADEKIGFRSIYTKTGTYNFITLTERTSPADGFIFAYTWY